MIFKILEKKIYYPNRLLIRTCFFHEYSSLVYGVYASKTTCAYKQAFTVKFKYFLFLFEISSLSANKIKMEKMYSNWVN